MAALAADRLLQKKGQITLQRYPVKAGAVIHYGAQVATDATGYLVPSANTAGLKCVGIAEEAADNTGGADGDVEVLVYRGAALVPTTDTNGVTQADVGADCFCADDNEVTNATGGAPNSVIAGEVMEVTSQGIWVNYSGKR